MKIGFIVGKNDEYYLGDELYDITPKKYYINDGIHTDVAVAMTVKQSYPDVKVDIIQPKDITNQRLKKKFDPRVMSESPSDAKYTSYSVNKGEKIFFCIRSKDARDKNKLIDTIHYYL